MKIMGACVCGTRRPLSRRPSYRQLFVEFLRVHSQQRRNPGDPAGMLKKRRLSRSRDDDRIRVVTVIVRFPRVRTPRSTTCTLGIIAFARALLLRLDPACAPMTCGGSRYGSLCFGFRPCLPRHTCAARIALASSKLRSRQYQPEQYLSPHAAHLQYQVPARY